jgi:ornithine cyclodeaminase/alanine dehydrogenase-like protein (mu-crystallin family)
MLLGALRRRLVPSFRVRPTAAANAANVNPRVGPFAPCSRQTRPMATSAAVDVVRILSEDDVRRCLSVEETIETNEQAFAALHAGRANVPERIGIGFPEHDGVTLFKPANVGGAGLGLKVVSIRPKNAEIGRPTVPATIVTFNEATGAVEAVVSATYLTGLRTAAGSAVATRAILRRRRGGAASPPPPTSLCVFGAGLQAELHIRCLRSVCPSALAICVRACVSRVVCCAACLRCVCSAV